jgi:hypothetical protein
LAARQSNTGQFVGVQPTNPPSDPIPVIDAAVGALLTALQTLLNQLQTPTAVLEGTVTLAVLAAPLIAANTPCKSVTIESVSTNAVVNVGNNTNQRYQLRPGATVSLDIDNLNKVYVSGTVGNVVTYIAVN